MFYNYNLRAKVAKSKRKKPKNLMRRSNFKLLSTANGGHKQQWPKASIAMQRLSYLSETVSSNKITRNGLVLSFKDKTIKTATSSEGTSVDSCRRRV